MDKLLERFLHYVSLDTQSKSGVRQVPSTEGQWKLLRLLKQQLEEMGLVNITLSEKGTLMATLPANVEGDIPAIGFISHVDTSPDFSGKNVNPQIVENYRGGDIALGIGDEVLSPVMFPVLHQLLGQTLITTDGKTLLGADDKAGVAEIMTALAVLKGNPIPHGEIKVAFTPDEEVGKGAKHFDVEAFGAQWAYTVDGGGVGELELREKVVEHPHILDIAQQAMRDCHITPEMKPIRGGTDGAQLSFMGLPCPNLFTGGYNYHGKHEFVTLEGMEKAVQVIVRIAELTAKRGQ